LTEIIFTVDVEDWAQSSWDRSLAIGNRCADQTRRIVELLAGVSGARATFFVLGLFAERHPDVVREIRDRGHEVACHGHGHVELFRLGRRGFAEDLQRSTETLAEITGERPTGYRAPDFSLVGETLWAYDVLAEAGYHYSSSVFPVDRGRYGIAGWPLSPRRVEPFGDGRVIEVPLPVLSVLGRRLPVGGGGYARLLPGAMQRAALRAAGRRTGTAPVFYCHPYELDPGDLDRPALRLPLKVRLHQGLGRRRMTARIQRLLACTRARALRDLLAPNRVTPIDARPFVAERTTERPPIFT
jgi:polysaccharide deacetylase family protein (PEP-CTERM system associated)